MIRKHVVVSGRVQGVFYRDTCREEARRHGVAGWVRNMPDGTVEAVFEGPAEEVERMVAWVHQGPSRAEVRGVEAEEETPQGLTGFQVRPTGP
ncbi:acylphosphatase [Streptomyces roseoverticillatus]|uniref:acylphosphatase n=1 Tax=Streptomyces roseoverticillatus TaxID=66429 RepID=UPI0004BF7F32|nr:acylphosphatase [Streptomyces roseoverticillatus]